MVSGGSKVIKKVSTGIMVTKAITDCVLDNSNCKDKHMISKQKAEGMDSIKNHVLMQFQTFQQK